MGSEAYGRCCRWLGSTLFYAFIGEDGFLWFASAKLVGGS